MHLSVWEQCLTPTIAHPVFWAAWDSTAFCADWLHCRAQAGCSFSAVLSSLLFISELPNWYTSLSSSTLMRWSQFLPSKTCPFLCYTCNSHSAINVLFFFFPKMSLGGSETILDVHQPVKNFRVFHSFCSYHKN